MITILKVIVGSQAHGLATFESDTDYRGVFVQSAKERLNPFSKPIDTQWFEKSGTAGGTVTDDTSTEVGKFLFEATKSNPTTLEVFKGTNVVNGAYGAWGISLQELFPHVWSSKGVYEAFTGYGRNQRTKMLDDRDGKAGKFAVAWLRTLYNAAELLRFGTFELSVIGTPIEKVTRMWKTGHSQLTKPGKDVRLTNGEVIDTCAEYEGIASYAYETMPPKETEFEPLIDYLDYTRNIFR